MLPQVRPMGFGSKLEIALNCSAQGRRSDLVFLASVSVLCRRKFESCAASRISGDD